MTVSTTDDKHCVLRINSHDSSELFDESDVPSLLVNGHPTVLDRIRYTVNVTDKTVTATTNYRMVRRRASGKVFATWMATQSVTITATATGLIMCRERSGSSTPHSRYLYTAKDLSTAVGRLVDPVDDPNATAHRRKLRRVVSREVTQRCGDFSDMSDRWLLLARMAQDMGDEVTVRDLVQRCTPPVRNALCDASSWAEAVKKLFGITRYRKSMTRAVTELLLLGEFE